jgi:hypothetical protein
MYQGNKPIPGLTDRQNAACEVATKMAPPDYHDGVLRNIAAQLGDTPTNEQVKDAIKQVLADLGLSCGRVD